MPYDATSWILFCVAVASTACCAVLLLERARLEKRFRFVKTLAEKDSLTLLYNHGAFHERLAVELERAARYERELSVIMLDLDDFKKINDTHGHLTGDRVLLLTAEILALHLRKSDSASRYGGDEFAVILPETDFEAAGAIAGRISAGIAEAAFASPCGERVTFTASIGYATCAPGSDRRDEILGVADELMFDSKRLAKGGVRGVRI
jgi:diguanylate cyclase (GGDEF)-like protein